MCRTSYIPDGSSMTRSVDVLILHAYEPCRWASQNVFLGRVVTSWTGWLHRQNIVQQRNMDDVSLSHVPFSTPGTVPGIYHIQIIVVSKRLANAQGQREYAYDAYARLQSVTSHHHLGQECYVHAAHSFQISSHRTIVQSPACHLDGICRQTIYPAHHRMTLSVFPSRELRT